MFLRCGAPTALLAVLLALPACEGDADDSQPRPQRLELRVGADVESFDRCPPVTVGRLGAQDVAFSGTLDLQGPDDEYWVFDVDHWYRGGEADLVILAASDVTTHYLAITVGGSEEGARYLVSGSRGAVSACLTRKWSRALEGKYAAAFAR